MLVQVIRKSLKYGRTLYSVGQTLEMPAKDVRVFDQLKRVIPVLSSPAVHIPAAPSVPLSLKTREFDHAGLDAAIDTDASDLLGETPAEEAPKKRTYKRRDMKAE